MIDLAANFVFKVLVIARMMSSGWTITCESFSLRIQVVVRVEGKGTFDALAVNINSLAMVGHCII